MPDHSRIVYPFAELEDLSGAISQAQGQVESVKSDIKSSSGTLASSWTGTATESWSAVQTKWDSKIQELGDTLKGLSVAVQNAKVAMLETEKKNADAFHPH